jgi:phytoene/squalene synthetase
MHLFRDALILLPKQNRRDVAALLDFFQSLRTSFRAAHQSGGTVVQSELVPVLHRIDEFVARPDGVCARLAITRQPFLDFQDGLQVAAVRPAPRDWRQFDAFAIQSALGPGKVLWRALGGTEAPKELLTVARGWALTEALYDLPQALRLGGCGVPLSELQAVDLSLEVLRSDKPAPGLSEVVRALGTKAGELLSATEAHKDLPASRSQRFASAWLAWQRRRARFAAEQPDMLLRGDSPPRHWLTLLRSL